MFILQLVYLSGFESYLQYGDLPYSFVVSLINIDELQCFYLKQH